MISKTDLWMTFVGTVARGPVRCNQHFSLKQDAAALTATQRIKNYVCQTLRAPLLGMIANIVMP